MWIKASCTSTILAYSLIGLVSNTTLAQNYNLYHFNDPVPIELSLNRISVIADTQDPSAVESLADLGITVTNVEPSPIPGWLLLDIELDNADGTTLEDALNRIARNEQFDFISPVFFDDFGQGLTGKALLGKISEPFPENLRKFLKIAFRFRSSSVPVLKCHKHLSEHLLKV